MKQTSMWWVGFFMTISVSLLAFLIILALSFAAGWFTSGGTYFNDWAMTPVGVGVMFVVGLLVTWGATWHQAKYARKRYAITDSNKASLYALGFMVILTILTFAWDWREGFVWFWEDYAMALISLAVFYFLVRKYLRG